MDTNETPIQRILGPHVRRVMCRGGDVALHVRCETLLSEQSIEDIWYLRDGDTLTITTMADTMPPGFQFHPTEVCDGLALRMLEQFNRSESSAERMGMPSLWRLRTGDRLCIIRRTDVGNFETHILEFADCGAAFLTAEPSSDDPFASRPPPPSHLIPPEVASATTAAYHAVMRAGSPREWQGSWTMSH